MSAREKLIRLARENTPDYGNHVPCDPETGFMFMGHDEYIAHVGKLLDEYAHELAEQQRMWALDYVGDGDDSSYDYTYAVTLGAKLAADLIDPGVSPVRPDEEPA